MLTQKRCYVIRKRHWFHYVIKFLISPRYFFRQKFPLCNLLKIVYVWNYDVRKKWRQGGELRNDDVLLRSSGNNSLKCGFIVLLDHFIDSFSITVQSHLPLIWTFTGKNFATHSNFSKIQFILQLTDLNSDLWFWDQKIQTFAKTIAT